MHSFGPQCPGIVSDTEYALNFCDVLRCSGKTRNILYIVVVLEFVYLMFISVYVYIYESDILIDK